MRNVAWVLAMCGLMRNQSMFMLRRQKVFNDKCVLPFGLRGVRCGINTRPPLCRMRGEWETATTRMLSRFMAEREEGESCEWLNVTLDALWLETISQAILQIAPARVGDQLRKLVAYRDEGNKDSGLPPWVRGFDVVGFSLGTNAPRIEAVHVPRVRGTLDGDTILDLQISFEAPDCLLAIKANLASFFGSVSGDLPGYLADMVSESARRTHPHLLIKVVNISVRGTLRVRLRPEDQAAFAAFHGEPSVGVTVELSAVSKLANFDVNTASLPLIPDLIQGQVLEALKASAVWPRFMTVDLAQPTLASPAEAAPPSGGRTRARVMEATGLPMEGVDQIFCTLWHGSMPAKQEKTPPSVKRMPGSDRAVWSRGAGSASGRGRILQHEDTLADSNKYGRHNVLVAAAAGGGIDGGSGDGAELVILLAQPTDTLIIELWNETKKLGTTVVAIAWAPGGGPAGTSLFTYSDAAGMPRVARVASGVPLTVNLALEHPANDVTVIIEFLITWNARTATTGGDSIIKRQQSLVAASCSSQSATQPLAAYEEERAAEVSAVIRLQAAARGFMGRQKTRLLRIQKASVASSMGEFVVTVVAAVGLAACTWYLEVLNQAGDVRTTGKAHGQRPRWEQNMSFGDADQRPLQIRLMLVPTATAGMCCGPQIHNVHNVACGMLRLDDLRRGQARAFWVDLVPQKERGVDSAGDRAAPEPLVKAARVFVRLAHVDAPGRHDLIE